MDDGDEVLIVEGQTVRLLGKVAGKVVSDDLSRELWQDLQGAVGEPWRLIYFIANAREIDLPFEDFRELMGYQQNFQLRGFTSVSADRLREFYGRYDDLYSVLVRRKENLPIERNPSPPLPPNDPGSLPDDATSVAREDESGAEDFPEETSDHLRIQHALLKMGRQAGERVWAPRNDQGRLRTQFSFDEFEETFAAGLDTQVRYVENIDVVWKHEFRIDAAFEVENSTAIYSGLLRFADLTMVAPNTTYPMFIVAPSQRRNRVREQLLRPTFRHLNLGDKVHYLPYEKIDEIGEFFEGSKGLSVDVLVGKSEKLGA